MALLFGELFESTVGIWTALDCEGAPGKSAPLLGHWPNVGEKLLSGRITKYNLNKVVMMNNYFSCKTT